jgi:hypothetical protein
LTGGGKQSDAVYAKFRLFLMRKPDVMEEYDNRSDRRQRDEVFSKKIRAGKRTYFFDVKATRGNDYYLIITESKRGFDDGQFVKHKIFLYKEDFNKFMAGLSTTIDHVKTELMPDYDFEQFDKSDEENDNEGSY